MEDGAGSAGDRGGDRRHVWPTGVMAVGGVLVWGGLIYAAVAIGRSRGDVGVGLPPISGAWDPGAGWWLLAPVLAAAAGCVAAWRMRWGHAVAVVVVLGCVWTVGLNTWRGGGLDELARPLGTRWEYGASTDLFTGPGDVFDRYVQAIPELSIHAKGHPPGVVALLVALDGLGMDDDRVLALLLCALAASTAAAVAVTVRELAGDTIARACLAITAFAPSAIWAGTSVDALFMAVAAWTLLLWVKCRGPAATIAAGVGGGCMLMLSYGLAPFGILFLAVRRDLRSLLLGGVGVAAVLGAAWLAGFSYPDGITATKAAYSEGISSVRPQSYWWFGNLAAAAIAAGPASGVGAAIICRRFIDWARGNRVVSTAVSPTVFAFLAVVLIDLTGFTKAEVERIWLPYLPWLAAAATPVVRMLGPGSEHGSRAGDVIGFAGIASVQVVWAVALAATVTTPW